jgi:integrase
MFRWGAEEELVPGGVHLALRAVTGLRRGKSNARETKPVRPAPQNLIDATLPCAPPAVAAMVRLQLLTACRPAEVCALRPIDLDTGDPRCWVYRPGSDRGPHGEHKTAHHGHDRLIFLGPKAQEVLRPYLGSKMDAYCFCPAVSEARRQQARRAGRKSPLTPSQRARRPKALRQRAPGNRYDVASYRRAIKRACDTAHPLPEALAPRRQEDGKQETQARWWARLTAEERDAVRAWRKRHRWSPNRLRHSRATELRRYGLDLAKTVMGHRKVETTQVYAEKDITAAMELMSRIG